MDCIDVIGFEADQLLKKCSDSGYSVNRIGTSIFELLNHRVGASTIIVNFVGSDKPVYKIIVDGFVQYYSNTSGFSIGTHANGTETLVNPFDLIKSHDLDELFNQVISELQSYKKIVVIEPKLPVEYVDAVFRINIIKNVTSFVNSESLIRTIFERIVRELKPIVISALDDVIFHERKNPHRITYSDTYFNYLSESIKVAIEEPCKLPMVAEKYSDSVSKELFKPMYNPVIDSVYHNHRSRTIIIVGNCPFFKELLLSKYNFNAPIISICDLDEIKTNYYSKKDYYWVFPSLDDCSRGILKKVIESKFYRNTDYCIPIHIYPFKLTNFCGSYVDHYHNTITTSSPINVVLFGSGNEVSIVSDKISNLDISLINYCSLTLEKGVQIAGKIQMTYLTAMSVGENTVNTGPTDFTIHDFNKITIGSSCLMSKEIQFLCGDGHPIFDINTEKCLNQGITLKNSSKNEIIIGDHVWVGIRVTVLSKTEVGSGSVIGACSLVNRKYPNNCIIAGVPGKVIRKDIAWNRRPVYDLFPDENALEMEFIQETVDLSENKD